MKIFFLVLLLAIFSNAGAQKVSGTVYNQSGDLLPFSSIIIKGTTLGTSANDKGNYAIKLTPGKYVLVCQRVGYTLQTQSITVSNSDVELNFILSEQKYTLNEVIISNGKEDPAYAIIRNAIKKRDFYEQQVAAFTCDLYTKDVIKLKALPKRVLGQKVSDEDRKSMGLDSNGNGIIYLSESLSKISSQKPKDFKLEVNSSRVSGSNSFGFTFPTFISFYNNNVSVFSSRLNPRGFISPIADGAIGFYKYKFLGSFWEEGKEVNSIRITPRRSYEPLFSGIINITENDWRIHSVDLLLTKTSQLEIIDSLHITQLHVPVNKETWRVKNQLLQFTFKQFGIQSAGDFLNVYSNYDVKPQFEKDFFNRVIIKYDTGVANQTKLYWDSVRPVPLAIDEEKDYKVKDSVFYRNKDSLLSQQSIDSLNKKQGAVKLKSVFINGINRTHYSVRNQYSYGLAPLLTNLEYNFAEGLVIQLKPYYSKYMKRLKGTLDVEPNLRYGVSNTHFNAWTNVVFVKKSDGADENFERFFVSASGGKMVRSFNRATTLKPFFNSISNLIFGNNFLKTYEDIFGAVSFGKRFSSGLRLQLGGSVEERIPLKNTTDYLFFPEFKKNITPNYPNEIISADFERHRAVIVSADISFKPGQRYIQFPKYKVALGSKYPLFSLNYTKGIAGVAGSDVDFDKWKFTISDDKNFKLLGTLKYKLSTGGFLNKRSVFIQDFTHYDANYSRSDYNGTRDYLNGFQLPLYYQYSNTDNLYGLFLLEHHFNGLFTNKIPLFKRLKWNLIAGSNMVILQKTNYIEAFIGLENIFKIFRLDVVSGFENGSIQRTGLRLGTGGLIGGMFSRSTSNTSNRRGGNAVSVGL